MSSRKKTYIFILVFAVIIIALGFMGNIHFIKHLYAVTLANLQKTMILVPAVICAFVFINSGYYWLVMLGCALIDAITIHYLAGNAALHFHTMAYTAFAFLVIVYLLNLVKSLIKD